MKKVLFFNMPEDESDFKLANNGGKMYCALWDISQVIRNKLKYTALTKTEDKAWEEIRTEFYKVLSDNDLNLDEMGG